MAEARPITTLFVGYFKLSFSQCPNSQEKEDEMSRVSHASVVSSLIYDIYIRPDLACAISIISHLISNPGRQHWEAIKWMLRYQLGTARLGLAFQRLKIGKSKVLQGYITTDYTGDLNQRKSTTGYISTVAECIFSWKTELQDRVALSTTELEYVDAAEASKEALWLRELVGTFSIIQDSIQVYCDSQSVIHLTKNHMYHKWTKHIDVRYHMIRF